MQVSGAGNYNRLMARRQHTVSLQVIAAPSQSMFGNRQGGRELSTEDLRRQIKGLLGKGPRKTILGNVIRADADIRIFGSDPLMRDDLEELVRYCREVGYAGVSILTDGIRLAQPGRAEALVEAGVSEFVLKAYSTDARVHDAIVRKKGSHERFLKGLEHLSGLDVDVKLQTPILAPRAQNLHGLLDTMSERLDRIIGIELSIPNSMPPGKTMERLAPPPLAQMRPLLKGVLNRAEDLAISAVFFPRSGIPFCGIPKDFLNEEVSPHHPNKPARLGSGNSLGASCSSCSMEKQCTGVRSWYRDFYGDAGFLPLDKPIVGAEKVDTLREHYSDPLVRARAAKVKLKVVRPVIHCNQRCPFCSANESSETQIAGRKLKKKLIRWYRLGVRRLSFSGGEPTLDDMLPEYFRLATQLGYSEIEIVTNGTKTHKLEYAKELVDGGLNRAFLSLHANNEELSAICTGRKNDFRKTVASLHNFLDLGVAVRINHVLTSLNAAYIPEFVKWFHGEFGSDIHISFAFVSPLYRAKENIETMMPRYSDVAPKLKEAMELLREWKHPFVVLARAGVPWCQLRGGYMQYSDLPEVVNEAHSEDAYKKVKGPQCEECAIFSSCPGVYKEYAEIYGTDELVPLTHEEVEVSPTSPNDPWEGVLSKNWGNFANHMEAFEQVDWDHTARAWDTARKAADAANVEKALSSTLEALGFDGVERDEGLESKQSPGRVEDLPILEKALMDNGVERIEEFAFTQGLKPVLYLTPQPGELGRYYERYKDAHVEVVQAAEGEQLGRGVSTGSAHLFVSREAELARRVAEVYRTGDPTAQAAEVGELMGYPRCCVAAFLALADRSNDSEIVYAVARRGCENPHPLLNLGVGYLIPFYPCRFDCSHAVEFAEKVLEGLFPGDSGVEMRQAIREEMSSPTVYFDKSRTLIFDGTLEDTRIRFDDVRYISRTQNSDQESLLMRRALEPFFEASRKAHIGSKLWEVYSPREKFSLSRRARGAGILLPFGGPKEP